MKIGIFHPDELEALVLVYGCESESPEADAVPDEIWERLHELGYIETVRDCADDYMTRITPAGRRAMFGNIKKGGE